MGLILIAGWMLVVLTAMTFAVTSLVRSGAWGLPAATLMMLGAAMTGGFVVAGLGLMELGYEPVGFWVATVTGVIGLAAGCLGLRVMILVDRRRVGGCPCCGYDLRGHAMGESCPECGASIQ